jgi:hypothetical protein
MVLASRQDPPDFLTKYEPEEEVKSFYLYFPKLRVFSRSAACEDRLLSVIIPVHLLMQLL